MKINGRFYNEKFSRRRFMKISGSLYAVFAIAGTVIPECTAGQKRYNAGVVNDRVVLELSRFPFLNQQWKHGIFVFENHPTLIIVNTPDGFVAFGANCTHKKCVVDWHDEEKHFVCPCHKGRYGIDGKVVSGPPPAPLPKYIVTIEGENLLITKG